jgi:hypothetical protein
MCVCVREFVRDCVRMGVCVRECVSETECVERENMCYRDCVWVSARVCGKQSV